MSIDASDSMFARCDECDLMAFDPHPCVECAKTDSASAYCSEHYKTCATCGETVCEEHTTMAQWAPSPYAVPEVRCPDCAPSDETHIDFNGTTSAERAESQAQIQRELK